MFPNLLKKIYDYAHTVDSIDLSLYIPNLVEIEKSNWITEPTPYLVIENLFTPQYASGILSGILDIIEKTGLSEERNVELFSRVKNYDAYSYVPPPTLESPFRVFYSREWYDLFKGISGFDFDNNVMTGLHHHKVGSENGYIHTDFNYYQFRSKPISNGLNHWNRNSMYQEDGGTSFKKDELEPGVILTRRAIALIYYLDTEPWKVEDGGETGFYLTYKDKNPAIKIPPKHNSLFVFQITPQSLHGFIKNNSRVRNTVIQWFHEPAESMDKRLTL